MEEAWEVVGDDRAGLFGQRLSQGMSISATRFHVGQVARVGTGDFAGVVAHAIDNKLMKSIASPWVADPEGLKDQQGALQLDCQFDRSL
jgi:hypothetical protein